MWQTGQGNVTKGAPSSVTSVGFVMFLVLGLVITLSCFPLVSFALSLSSLTSPVFPPQLHSITNHLPSVFSLQVPPCTLRNPHHHSCFRFVIGFFRSCNVSHSHSKVFFVFSPQFRFFRIPAQPWFFGLCLNKSSFILKYLHPDPNLHHATYTHQSWQWYSAVLIYKNRWSQ